MNLSPPTTAVFVISLILAVLAIIGTFVAIPLISANAFWVAIIAYIIEDDRVFVVNVFYGGRDFEALMRDDDKPA